MTNGDVRPRGGEDEVWEKGMREIRKEKKRIMKSRKMKHVNSEDGRRPCKYD